MKRVILIGLVLMAIAYVVYEPNCHNAPKKKANEITMFRI